MSEIGETLASIAELRAELRAELFTLRRESMLHFKRLATLELQLATVFERAMHGIRHAKVPSVQPYADSGGKKIDGGTSERIPGLFVETLPADLVGRDN